MAMTTYSLMDMYDKQSPPKRLVVVCKIQSRSDQVDPTNKALFETNAQLTWNKHINHIHSIITWSILRLRPNWGVHTFYLMSHGEIPLMVFKIL